MLCLEPRTIYDIINYKYIYSIMTIHKKVVTIKYVKGCDAPYVYFSAEVSSCFAPTTASRMALCMNGSDSDLR